MRRIISMSALALVVVSGIAAAQLKPQAQPQVQPQPQGDPFGQAFYSPDLVMHYQAEINLTEAQRNTISAAMQQAQAKVVDVQFKMSSDAEKLMRMVQKPTIDEAQAMQQVDQVLSLERELKRAQVMLAVRIKNALTPQQQAKLNQLRQK